MIRPILKTISKTKTSLTFSLVIVLSITACNPVNTSDTETTQPETTQPEITQTDTANKTESTENETDNSEAANSNTNSNANSTIELAIARDGIQLITANTGAARDFTFDTDITLVTEALTTLWGTPKDSIENAECPAGPITNTSWDNGFSINAMDGNFVGWNIRPSTPSANFQTIDGVGIGSPVSELGSDTEIIDSSLGAEFFSNGLSGLLSANTSDATIEDLWAGTNCIFR